MAVIRLCPKCGARCLPGKRHCPAHTRKDSRPSASARGYDSKWRKTRASYLRSHPTCQQDGCNEPATDVHHLDGFGPKGPFGHDPSNLLSTCHSCHSKITATEQKGGWNR